MHSNRCEKLTVNGFQCRYEKGHAWRCANDLCNKCGKNPRKPKKWMCADCLKAYDRIRYLEHREKWRDDDYIKRYGVSFAEKTLIFESQGKKCVCCGSKTTEGTGWQLDHDHVTKKVRGVICASCNLTLGIAKENVVRLKRCAAYLMRHKGLSVHDIFKISRIA